MPHGHEGLHEGFHEGCMSCFVPWVGPQSILPSPAARLECRSILWKGAVAGDLFLTVLQGKVQVYTYKVSVISAFLELQYSDDVRLEVRTIVLFWHLIRDPLGGRFGLVWCNCSFLRFPDPLGDRFGLVLYSCFYTLTFLNPLGDRFGLVRYNSYIAKFS